MAKQIGKAPDYKVILPPPAVNCAFDKMVPLHKLVSNPRNPNTHPEEQLRLLAKIIDYQGWRNPIVVSTRSGFIVKGHARLAAAELLGLAEAPVDNQDYDSEAQEWADLLADNRIAELAEMDRPMLKDLLQEIDTGQFDLELTGFTETALEDMMTESHNSNNKAGKNGQKIKCPECGYEW